VYLPCAGRYQLFADLLNNDAVVRLMQAKSRIRTAPALVFIEGASDLDLVGEEIPALAQKIALDLWPRPITIRVKPSYNLPSKVLKQLGGKKIRLGLRSYCLSALSAKDDMLYSIGDSFYSKSRVICWV
jgi:tRNA A37 threonylcarbamoyladenosine synthetase subunit TsaC/SUA5/YrdC